MQTSFARAALLLAITLAGCGSGSPVSDVTVWDSAFRDCASQPTWTLQFTGLGLTSTQAIAVDPTCNVVVCGWTDDTLFDGSPGSLSLDGKPLPLTKDGWFVAKVSADGKLRWAKALGGKQTKLASLSSGDIMITDGDEGPLNGERDWPASFVARLDGETGKTKWTRTLPKGSSARTVLVDDHDQIIVAGMFVNTVQLDGATIQAHGEYSADAFVARFDADGKLVSLHGYGGDDEDAVVALAIDPAGGLFLGGYAEGVWDTDCGECEYEHIWTQPWLARITASGDLDWEQKPGAQGYKNFVRSIAADAKGTCCRSTMTIARPPRPRR